ncbi:hypothetical protein CCB80_07370 [Armatimonadetes bacterium Uphvl-Ar1]|nr:hypothetical protein CCB80_07370 [Armatimonadetes bacterium Uphvl-Ar1]
MGWSGTKNGKLLALAESNGFEWLITLDDDLPPEQNWDTISVNVIVLKPRKQGKSSLYELVPKILLTINNPEPKQLSWITSDN